MLRKIFLLLTIALLGLGSGCAPTAREEVRSVQVTHHEYPFTAEMGEYHVELEVDHAGEVMVLIFEDTRDRQVRLLDLDSISGTVTLPDEGARKVVFRPSSSLTRKHISRRLSGVYTARYDWLKTALAFQLEVTVPFQAKSYVLVFSYDSSRVDPEIHYDRGREY